MSSAYLWRGGPRGPVLLIIVALSAAVALGQDKPAAGTKPADKPAAGATDKLPAADEILERSIEASGGKAALEKLHSRVIKGTFAIEGQGVKGPLTVYQQAPDKIRTVIELEGLGKIESGCDGKICWEIAATGPRVLEGAERAVSLREAVFNNELKFRELYEKRETLGAPTLDGRETWKLRLTPKEGSPIVVWIDQKTHLAVQSEMTIATQMGDLKMLVTPMDYRKVDGVSMPHRVKQVIADGLQTVMMTFDKIEHNVDIPAERFALPDPIRELVAKGGEKKDAGEKKDEKKAEKDKP